MDIGELQENGRAFAERAERNPWIQVWRIVKAEAERSGNDKLVEMYVRLFKAYEASYHPRDGDVETIATSNSSNAVPKGPERKS